MSKEILANANEIVNKQEEVHIDELIAEYVICLRKANKCGCGSCKYQARRAEEAFNTEWARINSGFDEEEDWVEWMARKNLSRNDGLDHLDDWPEK